MFFKPFLNKGLTAFLFLGSLCAQASEMKQVAETSRYQLGLVNSFVSVRGRFDPYGDYRENPEGSSVWLSTTVLTSSIRLTPSLDGSLGFAAVHVGVASPGSNASVWVLGSPSLGLHYEFWEPWHLTLHGGGTLPWKAKFTQADGMSSREVSGLEGLGDSGGSGSGGGASVHLSLGASKNFHPLRVSWEGGIQSPFAVEQELSDAPPGTPPVRIKKGLRFQSSQKLGYALSHKWGISAGLKQVWGRDTAMDGVDLVGTASRKFSTTLGLSYHPNVNWRWSAGMETQFPFYAYIANQSYSPSVTVSTMYTGF